MTCNVTVDGPCRRTLNFSIDRAAMDRELDERVRAIASKQRFKGFRPGKAPLSLVRKTHGTALAEEIRRRAMGRAFAEAIREHQLRPVGEPEMNLELLKDDAEGPFTFEFSIEVAPDVELQLDDRIPVTIVLPPVDDGMVDGEVERIRKQAASLEDAPEGTIISKADLLDGTVTYAVEGTELDAREGKAALEYDLVDGIRIEGSGAAFGAKQVGDTVELTTTLPAHFEPGEHAGKTASLRFTIERHRLVKLPEFDEELLGKLGVESEADLRGRIRGGIEAQRQQFREQQMDREIEKVLIEKHEFELPERLVSKNIDHRVHEYAHRLIEREGQSTEEGHEHAEQQRDEIARASQDGLKLAFILAQIAQDHSLTASVASAEDQVRAMAAQEGGDPEAAVASAQNEGWLGDVQEQLTQQAARRWLRERADVTETEPEPRTTGDDEPQPEEGS